MAVTIVYPEIDFFDKITILSLLWLVVFVAAAYFAAMRLLPKATATPYRVLFMWHAFDAMTHFCLELPFVYHCFFSWVPVSEVLNPEKLAPTAVNWLGHMDRAYGPQAGGDGLLAQLWMAYGNADIRWAGSDVTVVSLELLTIFIAGPLACLVCYLIYKKSPLVNIIMIVIATMEIYGDWMTFCPEWLVWSYNLDGGNFMYLWIYLWLFNGLWVILPVYAIYIGVKDILDAFAVRAQKQGNKKLR